MSSLFYTHRRKIRGLVKQIAPKISANVQNLYIHGSLLLILLHVFTNTHNTLSFKQI